MLKCTIFVKQDYIKALYSRRCIRNYVIVNYKNALDNTKFVCENSQIRKYLDM